MTNIQFNKYLNTQAFDIIHLFLYYVLNKLTDRKSSQKMEDTKRDSIESYMIRIDWLLMNDHWNSSESWNKLLSSIYSFFLNSHAEKVEENFLQGKEKE